MHISSPINKIIANVNKGLIWELYDDNIYLNLFNALIMTQFVWSLVRGWSCTSSGNSHNFGIIKKSEVSFYLNVDWDNDHGEDLFVA